MEKKFVSVVLYLHNQENNIKNFFDSSYKTIKENFENVELICVDDGCSDNTISAVKDYFSFSFPCDNISVLKMGSYQGLEASMNAGRDYSIGDFVFEFDTPQIDYTNDIIMKAFDSVNSKADIAIVAPSGNSSLSSSLFYGIFNMFSRNRNKICSDTFRLISRRAINRIKSISDFVPYRKALYANCGLKCETIKYKPDKKIHIKKEKATYERFNLAFDSFVYFTNFLERLSTGISAFFLLFTIGSLIYAFWDHFTNGSIIEGWTSTICFMSFGFFGIFVLLTIILKYLSVIVNLIFRRQKYIVESVEKIGGSV